LNVTGAVTFTAPTSNAGTENVTVNGSLNAGTVAFNGATTGSNRNENFIVAAGTATVGSVTVAGNMTSIQFTGAGLLKVSGALGVPATFTTNSQGTVELNGTAAQSVPTLTFFNLTLSNSTTPV